MAAAFLSMLDIVESRWPTQTEADIILALIGRSADRIFQSNRRAAWMRAGTCWKNFREQGSPCTRTLMHTVELLEQAIAAAGRCGIVVRQDWFGGSAAGACEFQGRRWVFVDLS